VLAYGGRRVASRDFASQKPYYHTVMNLLMLILIFLALVVGGTVFYFAWRLSSGGAAPLQSEEPGEAKESNKSPGSSENL